MAVNVATEGYKPTWSFRRFATRALLYLIAWTVALAVLFPAVYAILGGFRDTAQISSNPVSLPSPWIFHNYSEILGSKTFWLQVWKSLEIAVIATLLTVPVAALAAFMFARVMFRGRELLYVFFTLGLLFPVAVAILPIFLMIRHLGLLDNPLGVALRRRPSGCR